MDIFFLKETDSTINNENPWVNDFNRSVFFSHGASNYLTFVKHSLSLINKNLTKLGEF